MSRWAEKRKQQAEFALNKELDTGGDTIDAEATLQHAARGAAMGEGDEELFEKKMTKEEKKAAQKAAREAKKAAKARKEGKNGDSKAEVDKANAEMVKKLQDTVLTQGETMKSKELEEAEALLSKEGTHCTYASNRKGVDPRAKDINVQNFTMLHKGHVMLDETQVVLNYGNRYGLLGSNGSGKSTFLRLLGARCVPIPSSIDVFHLKEEVEASDTSALEAVMSVDAERAKLEADADMLNNMMGTDDDGNANGSADDENMDEQQRNEQIMDLLNIIYERLDDMDSSTAEVRARKILKGLGFTHAMQAKATKDFSGGWRMRVALARALFISPVCLLLDEPTNHLDMEAVLWLEDYLSKWNRILLCISHSQDFLNNVCSHMIHLSPKKKLVYYDGNYDQFVKTKTEKEVNQLKQYKWEQDQIKSMKEYIARFGHGTAKNVRQAQSKEKVLEKMVRAGLTDKPVEDKKFNFAFPNPGHLPPPVLAFQNVHFGYPKCEKLYDGISFGVDLDSRVALVGANGCGKTTLVKLIAGELTPTDGDIRPHMHLKMSRFTQHFVDVLDLTKTPLEYFQSLYPDEARDELRKYLGRFGVSGKMQVQVMNELSDGQKARVVLSKMGKEAPHILLLDEPTNHLDMESIDSLAEAIQKFTGGVILVSHDMRLISQVAKEIWVCENKTINIYKGDINKFKMEMRLQLGIGDKPAELKGDSSVAREGGGGEKEKTNKAAATEKKVRKDIGGISVAKSAPPTAPAPQATVSKSKPEQSNGGGDAWSDDEESSTVPPPAPQPAANGGACPETGKVEWRLCGLCNKRHP